MPKPNNENSNTGLRPYLSLRLPKTGANKNCIIAYANVSHPPHLLASLMFPCISCSISFGKTGMIRPKPITSIRRVMKMKPMAALPDGTITTIKCEAQSCCIFILQKVRYKTVSDYSAFAINILKPTFILVKQTHET